MAIAIAYSLGKTLFLSGISGEVTEYLGLLVTFTRKAMS